MYDMTRSRDGAPWHGGLPVCEQFAAHPGELQNPLLVPSVRVENPASAWPHRYLEHRRKSRALLNRLVVALLYICSVTEQLINITRRFYHQVRHGCENPDCSTPSCFSYQKRSSKAPIRPYTTLSARALATFLASQDYPERNLCPSRLPQVLDPQETALGHEPCEQLECNDIGYKGSPKKAKKSVHWCEMSALPRDENPNDHTSTPILQPKVATQDSVPVSKAKGIKKAKTSEIKKDVKSFTQALFDTISFKVFQTAEIPEGYTVWAPWARESSRGNRVWIRNEDKNAVELDDRPYGPLSASRQEHTEIVNQSHNQESLVDQYPITQEAENAIDITRSTNAAETHPRLNTNVRPRTDEALDTRKQTFSRTICGAIPKHLLTTSCSPFYHPVAASLVQPPMALARFNLENTAALVDSVRALSEPGAYSESQFLRSLGRPTAALQIVPFQLGYATRSQRRIAYTTQSLVHVLSNAKCLLHSFEGNLAQSKVFFHFSRIEHALRNLLEIDFHPSNLLESLWTYLSKSEQILRSQIQEGRYFPFQTVSHGLIDGSSEPYDFGKATYIHIMDVVVAALVALVQQRNPKEWAIMQRLRSSGRIIPRSSEWPCSDDRRNYLLDSMDIFDDEMALRLVRKFLRVTMMHCMAAKYLMQDGRIARPQESVLDRWIERCIASRTDWIKGSVKFSRDLGPEFVQYPFIYVLVDWLRAIILKEWDGRAIIPMGSPVWEAAEFLSRMRICSQQQIYESVANKSHRSPCPVLSITRRLLLYVFSC